MKHSPAIAAAPLLFALVTGCSDRGIPAATPEPEFDVLRQAIDRTQRLTLAERWRVGQTGNPSNVEFFLVRGVEVGEDGETFVLDAGNHRILVFDEAGTLLRQFGKEGDGPGEFRSASVFSVRRDTVLVRDSRRRVQFFLTDGSALETFELRFPDPDVRSPNMLVGTANGWMVAAVGYFQGERTGLPPLPRTHLFHLNATTGGVDPAGLRWESSSVGEYFGMFWIQPILTHRATASLDGRGRYLTADTASYRIDVYGGDGTHLLRVENDAGVTPIDDDLIDMWRASRNCPAGAEEVMECSREADQLKLSMPRTEHRPFISRLRAFPSGHFVVRRADLDPNPFDRDTRSEYDYFDPDGRFIGSTSGMVPWWFDGAELVAVERDEFGVESVVRYEVEGS